MQSQRNLVLEKGVKKIQINEFMCCVITKLFWCFLVLNQTHHIWRQGKRLVESPSGCWSGHEFKQWIKLKQMAVCLSGLPGLPVFDAIGEPATHAQRWMTWRAKFELYVTASGISDPTQKRALLLHLAGLRVRNIFNNSISANVRGGA